MKNLLTIAVPTFNRSAYLERLLAALADATVDLGDAVEIIVSDNASTDETPDVLRRLASCLPGARIVSNAANIGAEANVQQCFDLAAGKYVWIIGDDDMPKRGALLAIVRTLATEQPDIAYLPSEWVEDAISPDQGARFNESRYAMVNALTFGRRVNVFVTFLSGMIVKKSHAAADVVPMATGSNLPQLGWILPALKHGNSFLMFRDAPVVATGGNSGGYAVVKVFGVNLPVAIEGAFGRGSPMYRAIVGRTVTGYLPQLVWNVRTGSGGFAAEFPWEALRREIGRFPAFWGLVMPIGRAPLPVARGALLAARALGKLGRMLER